MTFTKEQLIEQATKNLSTHRTAINHPLAAIDAELFRIALAGMEAEPVAYMYKDKLHTDARFSLCTRFGNWSQEDINEYEITEIPLYTAPQPLTTSERAELENYRNAQQAVPGDIDARMKSAGMLSASEIIAGQPIDAFVKHAGVVDMGSLHQWAEMRRAEFLRMQARYELGDNEKDDLYEWVISHAAVFSELHVNIRASMQPGAVKDGWVACSERMPEKDGNYWGWWSESKRQGPVWFIKSELQAQFQSSEITHWMPLPAAPQQEV